VQRVHVIGRKNSGKTTLIVELVEHLTSQGWRVGTIKHTHHSHELDVPGKDSHQHRTAGAAVVGILASGMSAIFWPLPPHKDSEERYDEMSPLFSECDLVLVEGDTMVRAPKVEVWRAAASATPLAIDDSSIHALITDDWVDATLPVWRRSDVAELASRLLVLGFGGRGSARTTVSQPCRVGHELDKGSDRPGDENRQQDR